MGIATRSRRLTVTPFGFSGVLLPARFSFQRLKPTSQRASACMAEVFPELLGPMKTTALPRSIATSPKRLKFRMTSLVSISYRRWNDCMRRPRVSHACAECSPAPVSDDTRC